MTEKKKSSEIILDKPHYWRANKDVAWQEDGLLSLNYQAMLNFFDVSKKITIKNPNSIPMTYSNN